MSNTAHSTADDAQDPDNGGGVLNPQTVTIDAPGGIRVKLPILVLVHILSLAGVCGGTYSLSRPGVDAATQEITHLREELTHLKAAHNAISERLARIETNTENTRDTLRELRAVLYRTRRE